MRTLFATALLALLALPASGCFSLHADVPEDVVRRHVAREEGIDLASVCSHEGRTFSEGARTCMASLRMTCDPEGRWVEDGAC